MLKKISLLIIILCLLSCNIGGKKESNKPEIDFRITEAPEESLEYLKNVAIKININDQSLMTEDEQLKNEIENARIIVSGEAHQHNDFRTLNLDFIKYFYENYGIRYYLAEMNWIDAIDVNKYINGDNEEILTKLFQRYKNTDLATKETYEFFQEFRSYNLTLPKDKRIVYIGVDIAGSWENVSAFFDFIPDNTDNIPEAIKPGINEILNVKKGISTGISVDTVLENIENNRSEYENYLKDDFKMFYYTVKISKESLDVFGTSYTLNERDAAIYSNILKVLELYPDEKFYGSWGSAHVAKGKHYNPLGDFYYTPWVAHANKNDSPLKGKVLSFYAFPVNTKTNEGVDELADLPDVATRYFKEAAEDLEYSHAIFPLNRDKSPFNEGLYLIPDPQDGGVTTDYIDYVLFVSGSEMMESYF